MIVTLKGKGFHLKTNFNPQSKSQREALKKIHRTLNGGPKHVISA
jgi:hypothetical protein